MLMQGTGLLQFFRQQAFRQKRIFAALLHQQRHFIAPQGHQLAGVVLAPSAPVCSQITAQGFLAPGGKAGRAHRCKCRDGGINTGISQSNNHGAVATHGMTHDGFFILHWKLPFD
jgi:hypothetical protein